MRLIESQFGVVYPDIIMEDQDRNITAVEVKIRDRKIRRYRLEAGGNRKDD